MKETPVLEVIKSLGLPENTKYLGYVVHLPGEDEFLAYAEVKKGLEKRVFSQTPDTAKVYKSYKKALQDAKSCEQLAEPWILFDIGDQYHIAPTE